VLVKDRCTVCAERTTGWEIVLVQDRCKVMWVMWNHILVHSDTVLLSVRLEKVVMLTQDRCMFWAECTIGSEIILDAPDGTPRRCRSCGI
jgi:hypothetical protein